MLSSNRTSHLASSPCAKEGPCVAAADAFAERDVAGPGRYGSRQAVRWTWLMSSLLHATLLQSTGRFVNLVFAG